MPMAAAAAAAAPSETARGAVPGARTKAGASSGIARVARRDRTVRMAASLPSLPSVPSVPSRDRSVRMAAPTTGGGASRGAVPGASRGALARSKVSNASSVSASYSPFEPFEGGGGADERAGAPAPPMPTTLPGVVTRGVLARSSGRARTVARSSRAATSPEASGSSLRRGPKRSVSSLRWEAPMPCAAAGAWAATVPQKAWSHSGAGACDAGIRISRARSCRSSSRSFVARRKSAASNPRWPELLANRAPW